MRCWAYRLIRDYRQERLVNNLLGTFGLRPIGLLVLAKVKYLETLLARL